MKQEKSIEHANWNVFNTWWRSLCLCCQLEDTSCTKKLLPHSLNGVLAHSSHRVFTSWRFWGLAGESWSSVPFTNVLLDWSVVIDWAIQTPLFSSSGTNWPSLLQYVWITVLLRGPPKSDPHRPGGMVTDSSQDFPVHGSVHVPFDHLDSAGTMRRETVPYHDAFTSKLHCRNGIFRVICRAIFPPNIAHLTVAERFDFCLVWPHYILPASYRLLRTLCSKLQTSFSAKIWHNTMLTCWILIFPTANHQSDLSKTPIFSGALIFR